MHKNFPSKLRARDQRCVWPVVVLMKHNFSPIHQLCVSSLLQLVQGNFMIDVELLGDTKTANMAVCLVNFHDLSTFSTISLPVRGVAFTFTAPERKRSNHCGATRTEKCIGPV
uniref:Uncharacterized protein n=1 Tax=Lepeophtheirus salmonis TaxID=72036 RepID=A0A0K2TBU9_LEPSM